MLSGFVDEKKTSMVHSNIYIKMVILCLQQTNSVIDESGLNIYVFFVLIFVYTNTLGTRVQRIVCKGLRSSPW